MTAHGTEELKKATSPCCIRVWRSVLKAMTAHGTEDAYGAEDAHGTEEGHLSLLYQSLALSVAGFGLSLTTMSQINQRKPDRVQNEAMRVVLETTKHTSTGAMY